MSNGIKELDVIVKLPLWFTLYFPLVVQASETLDRHHPCSPYLPILLPHLLDRHWVILWWKDTLGSHSAYSVTGKADPKSVPREVDDWVEFYEEIRTGWMMVPFTERRLRGPREGNRVSAPIPYPNRDGKYVIRYGSLVLTGEVWSRA